MVWRLGLVAFLTYLLTGGSNFASGDAFSELRVAQSLLQHGWVDVPRIKPDQICAGWGCRGADGRFYATHGIGYSLFLLPFYAAADAVIAVDDRQRCANRAGRPGVHDWDYCVPVHMISLSGALIGALTVALICLLGVELGYGGRRALLSAAIYGFATLAWPYARYGFDVSLTALLLLGAFREALLASGVATIAWGTPLGVDRRWLRCGGLAALAALVRLPAAAAIAPLCLCVLLAGRRAARPASLRAFAAFGAPLALACAFTCWYNWARFGSPSPLADGHASNSAESLVTPPWASLAGMLISPGKGIIWYMPALALSLACIPAFRRRHPAAALLAGAMVVCGMVPYLPVRDWYGGDAWGPRFLVQLLPLAMLPILALPSWARDRWRHTLATLIIAVSAAIQLAGLLVNYHLRLAIEQPRGVTSTLLWDPRASPLGDHLVTLWGYLTHLDRATRIPDRGDSFDVWWLVLWRNDGLSPRATVAAGIVVAAALALASIALTKALQRLHGTAPN